MSAKVLLIIIICISQLCFASARDQDLDLDFFQKISTLIKATERRHKVYVEGNFGTRLSPEFFSGISLEQLKEVEISYSEGTWFARASEVDLSDASVITVDKKPLAQVAQGIQYELTSHEIQFFTKIAHVMRALDEGRIVHVQIDALIYPYSGYVSAQLVRTQKKEWEFVFPRGVHHTDFSQISVDGICQELILGDEPKMSQ